MKRPERTLPIERDEEPRLAERRERAPVREDPPAMEIDQNELWILSYYRESELAGALVMGRLARETDDDELRVRLTEHCAEEASHAWLWTRTILEVGGTPLPVSETHQSLYYAETGPPRSVLEVLALTQVFEKRVLRHFRDHLRRPGTHPAVAATLRRMITDEVGHVGWVKERLERHAREKGPEEVARVLRRFADVDRKVYAELLEHRNRFGDRIGRRPAREPGDRTGMVAHPAGAPGNGSPPAPGRSEVVRRIGHVASRALGLQSEDLDPDTALGMIGIDSLDLVVLIAAIEEEFEIELAAADAERLYTVDDLVARVAELAAATGPGRPGAR